MTSPRQIDANRRNAQKSTGPRTDEGKTKVALNAVKHGLLSQHVVLANEDEREFEDFTRRLRSALTPVGELEEMLVGSIAASAWRLRRVLRVERGLFVAYVAEGARLGTAKEDLAAASPDERRKVVEDLLRNLMLLADRDQVVDDEPLRRSSASLAALTSVIAAGVS